MCGIPKLIMGLNKYYCLMSIGYEPTNYIKNSSVFCEKLHGKHRILQSIIKLLKILDELFFTHLKSY